MQSDAVMADNMGESGMTPGRQGEGRGEPGMARKREPGQSGRMRLTDFTVPGQRTEPAPAGEPTAGAAAGAFASAPPFRHTGTSVAELARELDLDFEDDPGMERKGGDAASRSPAPAKPESDTPGAASPATALRHQYPSRSRSVTGVGSAAAEPGRSALDSKRWQNPDIFSGRSQALSEKPEAEEADDLDIFADPVFVKAADRYTRLFFSASAPRSELASPPSVSSVPDASFAAPGVPDSASPDSASPDSALTESDLTESAGKEGEIDILSQLSRPPELDTPALKPSAAHGDQKNIWNWFEPPENQAPDSRKPERQPDWFEPPEPEEESAATALIPPLPPSDREARADDSGDAVPLSRTSVLSNKDGWTGSGAGDTVIIKSTPSSKSERRDEKRASSDTRAPDGSHIFSGLDMDSLWQTRKEEVERPEPAGRRRPAADDLLSNLDWEIEETASRTADGGESGQSANIPGSRPEAGAPRPDQLRGSGGGRASPVQAAPARTVIGGFALDDYLDELDAVGADKPVAGPADLVLDSNAIDMGMSKRKKQRPAENETGDNQRENGGTGFKERPKEEAEAGNAEYLENMEYPE
ncbi:MAG: hypothetical protein LBV15_05615, partial [Planctomycetota bacterium]|nr:hypothetical protein [Planctomycetota bacterium]